MQLDRIDERIVYALQRDARDSTTTEIADRVGVSSSTVRNRIEQLESDGILTGYRAIVDYEEAGFPLQVLMVCTAPIADRGELARRALEVPGVVNVRELMVGEKNVRAEAVGESNDDLTRIATALSDLGLEISEEILIRQEHYRPLEAFAETTEE